jgi:hypothetical protein
MFLPAAKESPKSRSKHALGAYSPGLEKAAPPNAVWHQIATRIQSTRPQAKLVVSRADDPSEREADRTAEQVVNTADLQVQRSCACGACPACLSENTSGLEVRRKRSSDRSQTDTAAVGDHESMGGDGESLDPETRSFMESRFGHSFGHVRVHTGEVAANSARSINALAYTHGRNIVFAQRQYAPERVEGKRLIAHELTHVLQQGKIAGALSRSSTAFGTIQRAPASPVQGPALRKGTITVAWADEDRDFYHRVVNAIAASPGFSGIATAELWQPFHDPAFRLHSRYQRRASPKAGSPVQLRATAFFDPSVFHGRITDGNLEIEQDALIGEAKLTGTIKPLATFADRAPNELGPEGRAELSFTSSSGTSAASLGGLKWYIASGGGSLIAGDDGKATFTGASSGYIDFELKVFSGVAAGTVVANQHAKILAVQDMVSQDPAQPERFTIIREGLTPELLAQYLYGDRSKATSIWAVWDEKARGEPWKVTTIIPKGMWIGIEYRYLKPSLQKLYDATVDIKARATWGARPPIIGDANRTYEAYTGDLEDVLSGVVVHHSGNSNLHTMKAVQDLHLDKKEAADINYHYGIDRSGQTYEGRPINIKGAHVKSANTGNIGIVFLADLDTETFFDINGDDVLTPEMESSLLHLVHYLMGKYPGIKYLGGHYEFAAAQGDERSCPGNLTMAKMNNWRSSTGLKKPS